MPFYSTNLRFIFASQVSTLKYERVYDLKKTTLHCLPESMRHKVVVFYSRNSSARIDPCLVFSQLCWTLVPVQGYNVIPFLHIKNRALSWTTNKNVSGQQAPPGCCPNKYFHNRVTSIYELSLTFLNENFLTTARISEPGVGSESECDGRTSCQRKFNVGRFLNCQC